MNLGTRLILVGITLMLGLTPFVQPGFAAQSGYVVYNVRATSGGTLKSYSINESVSPSQTKGESILSIVLRSASTNFTYAHIVNSSLDVFPYLPAVANLTYTYSNDSYVITAHLTKEGSSSITFQGATYALTDYSFNASVSKAQTVPRDLNGNFAVLPSGLIYSATVVTNDTSAMVMLVSTSLPLAASSGDVTTEAASATVGASAVVGAFALSLGIRSRGKTGRKGGQRQDYWVD